MTLTVAVIALLVALSNGRKPLVKLPARCWFFGHVPGEYACKRCRAYGIDYPEARWVETFWTS